MIPYLVCEFAKTTLSNLVKECFGSDFPDIFKKNQIDYIYRYLKDLGAKTVLLEFEYVDKDYLEDYSRYYVKRFKSGGYKCGRLHFFSEKINHRAIEQCLATGDRLEAIQESYLGFVVIKPLPKTFIGKTCLKQYPKINLEGHKKYCLTKEHEIDLFGIKLKVNSVAFQEQDKVISACATTAIWSSLQALHWRNSRDIPACSEITTNALNYIAGSSNSFPNKELSNKQILRALDIEQLRHHNENLEKITQVDFFETIQCHIDSGLPLILGGNVYEVTICGLKKLAGHAVTVLGYKLNPDALYIHDDRMGPYARAAFLKLGDGTDFSVPGNSKHTWGLALQEKDDTGAWKNIHEIFVPESLIVPTHQKVRLPHSYARNTCNFIVDEYKNWLDTIVEADTTAIENFRKIKFTLRLQQISEIRQKVFNLKFSDEKIIDEQARKKAISEFNDSKVKFLTDNYARFQWVASFSQDNIPAFKILFDATDIPQGNAVSGIFFENKNQSDAILTIFRMYAKSDALTEEPLSENFYSSFLKFLKEPKLNRDDHLNKHYGELRAPLYLKDIETVNGQIANNSSVQQFFGASDESLDTLFETIIDDDDSSYMIWAITHDGALLIGKEVAELGHPCLTGFKPARISGELRKKSTQWEINSKSGRFSNDYLDSNVYLGHALNLFKTLFHKSRENIVMKEFHPE